MIKRHKLSATISPKRFVARWQRPIRTMVGAGLLMCAAGSGWAACTVAQDFVPKIVQIDIREIIIRDQGIGDNLGAGSDILSFDSDVMMADCNSGFMIGDVEGFSLASGYENVYESGIQGVGLKLSRVVNHRNLAYPFQTSDPDDMYLRYGALFVIDLIKLGPIRGGILKNGRLTIDYTDGDGRGKPLITTMLAGQGIIVKLAACTLAAGSKSIQVDMPEAAISDFTKPGTMGARKAFDIVLDCPDMGTDRIDVYTQIESANQLLDTPGLIGLTPTADMAKGIGIMLLGSNGAPFALAAPKYTDSHYGAAGQLILTLQAAYYQITDNPTAGAANATATFTLSYR